MEKSFAVTAAHQLGSHALLWALLPWQMQREGVMWEDSTAPASETLPSRLAWKEWKSSLKRAAESVALFCEVDGTFVLSYSTLSPVQGAEGENEVTF